MAVWILALVGVFTHLILDAVKSFSFYPLKAYSKDIEASTRLWMATSVVNLLALIQPALPFN
jgi:membrane-bound metal-dependent hydrolase YbcI (DUF457 family)